MSGQDRSASLPYDQDNVYRHNVTSILGMGRTQSDESGLDIDELKIHFKDTGGLISSHAEIFRSRLIEDFHLLDCISEQGKVEAPTYFPRDVQDDDTARNAMLTGPFKLVQFHRYSAADKLLLSLNDRRKNRIKNRHNDNPPLDMWANWIIESKFFKNFMLVLILVNSFFLGIQATLKAADSSVRTPTFMTMEMVLDILDYCALFIFLMEIFLKWLDDFWNFWKNGWNIFDFIVTFLSIIPEVINFSTGNYGNPDITASDLADIADNLRVFRILRSLKMVTRFQQVRLIALAVAKAFKAMVFITILLFTFMYIFAIFGVTLFDAYSESPREDLQFKSSFSTVLDSLATLFQLFTLDHWHAFYMDISKVVNPTFSGIYIIIWICIGSFIFRNIFVGIMVNNFQNIRNDLVHEIQEIEEAKQANIKLGILGNELQKQDDKHREIENMYKSSDGGSEDGGETPQQGAHGIKTEVSSTTSDHKMGGRRMSQFSHLMGPDLQRAVSRHMQDTAMDSRMWQIMVMDNLEAIAHNPIQTIWPRDTLFSYFILMEHLMENLHERGQILSLAAQALLQTHDIRGRHTNQS